MYLKLGWIKHWDSSIGFWSVLSHGALLSDGPILGLMLCCWCLEILSNFMFELLFYKGNPTWQRSMHMSRGEMHAILMVRISCSPVCMLLPWWPMSTEFFSCTMYRSSKKFWKSEFKVKVLSLWSSKGREWHWQNQVAMFSTWTRTCFECRREAMLF